MRNNKLCGCWGRWLWIHTLGYTPRTRACFKIVAANKMLAHVFQPWNLQQHASYKSCFCHDICCQIQEGCPKNSIVRMSLMVCSCFIDLCAQLLHVWPLSATQVPNHVFVRFYYDTIAVGDSFPRIGLEQWKGGKSDQHYLTKKHPNMYHMCFFQHNSPHPAPPSPFCTGEARVQRCAPGVAGLQDLRGVGWLRICCWDVGNDPGI